MVTSGVDLRSSLALPDGGWSAADDLATSQQNILHLSAWSHGPVVLERQQEATSSSSIALMNGNRHDDTWFIMSPTEHSGLSLLSPEPSSLFCAISL